MIMKTQTTKKICMLASGGDAQGMNACMESIFNYAASLGWEVWVSPYGYDGLVRDEVMLATRERCTNISHLAGCVYKCSRSPEFKTDDGKKKAAETCRRHAFDAVIAIGGNGTLAGLENFTKATGINVIGIPATVDNDCYYTNNALGFSSAVEAVVRYIDQIKPTMQTNERNFLLEVMGKGSSEIAISAGIAGFANLVDRSESRFTVGQIAEIFNTQRQKGNKSCMALLEEHRSDTSSLLDNIKAATEGEVRFERAYYYQRGAAPSARDRFLGAHYGVMAVDLVRDGKFGVAVGMLNDYLITVKLEEANKAKPKFNSVNYNLLNKISNW